MSLRREAHLADLALKQMSVAPTSNEQLERAKKKRHKNGRLSTFALEAESETDRLTRLYDYKVLIF